MINNRQNGRRGRGRNGVRPQGGNGGGGAGRPEQGNRIDNRARGNAAQLLEKYKALARDTQMAGDRVMTEYYLQFADHYFRVLSDTRARFEEQRRPREDYPQGANFQDEFDGDDGEGDITDSFDDPRPDQRFPDRAQRQDGDRGAERQGRQNGDGQDRAPRADRGPRQDRDGQDRGDQRAPRAYQDRGDGQVRDDQDRAERAPRPDRALRAPRGDDQRPLRADPDRQPRGDEGERVLHAPRDRDRNGDRPVARDMAERPTPAPLYDGDRAEAAGRDAQTTRDAEPARRPRTRRSADPATEVAAETPIPTVAEAPAAPVDAAPAPRPRGRPRTVRPVTPAGEADGIDTMVSPPAFLSAPAVEAADPASSEGEAEPRRRRTRRPRADATTDGDVAA